MSDVRFRKDDRVQISACGILAGICSKRPGRLGTVTSDQRGDLVGVRWDGVKYSATYSISFIEHDPEWLCAVLTGEPTPTPNPSPFDGPARAAHGFPWLDHRTVAEWDADQLCLSATPGVARPDPAHQAPVDGLRTGEREMYPPRNGRTAAPIQELPPARAEGVPALPGDEMTKTLT